MTEMETRRLVEDLAPLDGTAQSLARWLAATSFAAECRMYGHPGSMLDAAPVDRADWLRLLDVRVASFAAALLTRTLAAFDVEAADHAAAEIQRVLGDGEEASDVTSRWLALDRVDAERIVRAVTAERQQVPA